MNPNSDNKYSKKDNFEVNCTSIVNLECEENNSVCRLCLEANSGLFNIDYIENNMDFLDTIFLFTTVKVCILYMNILL